jgi:large subunit ribosomal protein L4
MSLQISALTPTDTQLNVSEDLFGQEYNEALIHQLVIKHLAGARAGTKAQKTRSDVSGGGIKPWRQKGTGRARSGTTRSPLWRTGGVTFAARPRNFDQKLNKKMFRAGIKSILSELLRQNRLVIGDSILPQSYKTKEFASKFKDMPGKRILVLVEKIDQNLSLASRNLAGVEVIESHNLNPVLLINAGIVVATSAAIKKLEESLV